MSRAVVERPRVLFPSSTTDPTCSRRTALRPAALGDVDPWATMIVWPTCSGRLMRATTAAHVPAWGAVGVGAGAVDGEPEGVGGGVLPGAAGGVVAVVPAGGATVEGGRTPGSGGAGVVPQDPSARTSGTRPAARTGRSTRRP